MSDTAFERDGDRYVPTKHAGSPWSDDLMHGGPPAALMARAIEQLAATDEMRVVRLTVDLFRPVPMAPLEVAARSVREGKRIHVVDAVITAAGVEVCRASGLLLRATHMSVPAGGTPLLPPGPETLEGGPLIGPPGTPRRAGFHTASEMRRLPRAETGTATSWIKTPELLEGEAMTSVVRLAATCDFVNAVASIGMDPNRGLGTINTDSTIYVHRPPVGEWIALQVERALEPTGIGVSDAVLFDREGVVGRATQAVLANQMR